MENEQKNTTIDVSNSGNQNNSFLDSIKMSQDFQANVGVIKLLTTVQVKKPDGQNYIRVNPDPAWRLPVATIEIKQDREIYIVPNNLVGQLSSEVKYQLIFTAITRQGTVFLWPIPLPGPDGKVNPWHASAMEAAELATKNWIRIKADMSLGAYSIYQAASTLDEPEWPDISFEELMKLAFKNNIIQDLDHPILKKLRGEM